MSGVDWGLSPSVTSTLRHLDSRWLMQQRTLRPYSTLGYMVPVGFRKAGLVLLELSK